MTYTECSLAIVEHKLNELRAEKMFIEHRIDELVVIRNTIVKELAKEYEKIDWIFRIVCNKNICKIQRRYDSKSRTDRRTIKQMPKKISLSSFLRNNRKTRHHNPNNTWLTMIRIIKKATKEVAVLWDTGSEYQYLKALEKLIEHRNEVKKDE